MGLNLSSPCLGCPKADNRCCSFKCDDPCDLAINEQRNTKLLMDAIQKCVNELKMEVK